ncbi:hypothetical protein EJ04DRAFT_603238 [Polyplosphaeria fusca]|uniref:VOC domain-containing protein n=1 Tax=Polyplosphaeria fusca TaxID=682080 RepID=A0A9P4R000_9PLEO|nr:hypothetical protein EJ04DRAFT_603238 [Polyplosphaeria fusca]
MPTSSCAKKLLGKSPEVSRKPTWLIFSSVKAGAAHIAFTAPSRTSVRDFYAAALNAGGRPNGAPGARTEDADHFNAAVLDFDGNSIEVVFRNEPDIRDDGTVIEHSRVLTWQRSVAESIRDDRSVVSSRAPTSAPNQTLPPAPSIALSKAPSVISKAASMVRSVSEPVAVPQVQPAPSVTTTSSGDSAAKKIIGTLIGAAAGAAVVYAAMKSEGDSAKKEAKFVAFQKAKALEAETQEQPKAPLPDPQLIHDAPPPSIHRNISDTGSRYSVSQAHVPRAIEPAPSSYYGGIYRAPSYTTVPPTQVADRPMIEYAPAYSVAPSRARTDFTVPHRSFTSPEVLTVAKARSVAPSAAPSAAPSTLISSFVPEQVPRRSSEGSIASYHSSRSKAKSSHTHASKHTSASKHSSKSRSRAPSPSPSPTPGKAASIVGSILGRDAASTASKKDKVAEYLDIDDLDINDSDTVAPSDSISNAGSRRSHRSHKSSSRSGSVASKHSHSSKHGHKSHRSRSKDSHHSHHSHSSKKSSHHSRDSPLSQEWHDVEQYLVPPTVVSEPSDASTVRPSSKAKASRKDSVHQYDGLFSGNANWGAGSAASLPVRGITESMVGESREGSGRRGGKRSVVSYAMGQ